MLKNLEWQTFRVDTTLGQCGAENLRLLSTLCSESWYPDPFCTRGLKAIFCSSPIREVPLAPSLPPGGCLATLPPWKVLGGDYLIPRLHLPIPAQIRKIESQIFTENRLKFATTDFLTVYLKLSKNGTNSSRGDIHYQTLLLPTSLVMVKSTSFMFINVWLRDPGHSKPLGCRTSWPENFIPICLLASPRYFRNLCCL